MTIGIPDGAIEIDGSLVIVGVTVGDSVAGDPVGVAGLLVGSLFSGA